MSPLFDRYTERAKRVLMFAHEESRRLNHDYIGTEHLLLGLVREKKGTAARILSSMDVDVAKARAGVENVTERGKQSVVGDINLTERGKNVIVHAAEEARLMRHGYIGTEHMLLGLARDGKSTGAQVLSALGVGETKVRSAVEFTVARGEEDQEEDQEEKPAGESRLSLSPGAQKAFGLAADEARRLGHSEIGTGHLLLGLAREGKGFAAGELQGLGVDVQRVRQQVSQAVSQGEAS